jgi:hypothetical protein
MSVNMHLRDVPDDVHHVLARRAEQAGMSLRQYTLKVLEEHCGALTLDDWSAQMARRRAAWLVSDREAKFDSLAAVRAGQDDLYGDAV